LRKDVTSATVPQNALVTVGPSTEPAGRRGLVERISSIQVIGASQRVFVAGPVGPLLKLFSYCPQRPS
jgi:hypothetical protein